MSNTDNYHIVEVFPNCLMAMSKFGKLVLDELFFATRSCCVDDGQYWITDKEDYEIATKTLAEYGFSYKFQ